MIKMKKNLTNSKKLPKNLTDLEMNSTINFEDVLDIQEADIEEMMMLLDQNVDQIETIMESLSEDAYFENLEYEIRYN